MTEVIAAVEAAQLIKYVPKGLSYVVGIVKSKVVKPLAIHLYEKEVAEFIKPQLEQIQSALNDMKVKDHKVAQDLFEDVFTSMSVKFHGYSSCPPQVLKDHSDRIEKDLSRAQEKAIEANHSGLSTAEQLTSFKWIIITEMLRVLNDATSKKTLDYDDTKRIENMLAVAREKCFKYLKKANELQALKDFILTKIPVEGYAGVWKLKVTDRTEMIRDLLFLNLQLKDFFHYMHVTYLTAATSLTPVTCPKREIDQKGGLLQKFWAWGSLASNTTPSSGQQLSDDKVLQMQFQALSTNDDIPLPLGMEPFRLAIKLLEVEGVNEGLIHPDLQDPNFAFQYGQLIIQCLGMVKNRDPNSCFSAGLQEFANLTNGGTVSASSHEPGYPAEEALSGGVIDVEWRSQVPSQLSSTEFIQRDLVAPVSPCILAVKSWYGNDKHCGPLKFKLLACKNGSEEWETLLEVEGLQWGYYNAWKFWSIPTVNIFQSFRVEIDNKSRGVLVAHLQLFGVA